MEVLCLARSDCALLAARFVEHGNSQRRMIAALEEAGAAEALERLRTLRRLECQFSLDLGSLCHRFEHRHDTTTHPIERGVLDFVARLQPCAGGGEDLWILVDRVRQVRDLVEGERLVLEPES